MKIRYYNKEKQIKNCKFGYRQMLMKRLNKHEKLSQALRSPSYHHVLIKEAISYISGIASLSAVGIHSSKDCLPSLKSIVNENKADTIDSCLVKWMCTTGEMRNHEAVRCHCDGNNSHRFEVYSLFHRAGVQCKDGFLYLPLDNVVLKLKCDKHNMVCSLKQTPHVADNSRNHYNFSKVHGPMP